MNEITPCPLCSVNYTTPEQVAYHLRYMHRWTENSAIEWYLRSMQTQEEAA